MNFVSFAELVNDVKAWSQLLPTDIVAVAGVPRSGMLPALHLALHRNLHLVTLDDLSPGRTPWERPLRRNVAGKTGGRVLVLEDSVNTGRTLAAVRKKLSHRDDILYGALYFAKHKPPGVDLVWQQVPQPRIFEWNLFHAKNTRKFVVDLDGVLCEDWLKKEADNGPEQQDYYEHLLNARPLNIPSYPVRAIVTARLEKYRPETLAWLRKYDIHFTDLIMSPHATAAARRKAHDHARRKAEWYKNSQHTLLFIESSLKQAKTISQLTKRAVLCLDNMQFFKEVH